MEVTASKNEKNEVSQDKVTQGIIPKDLSKSEVLKVFPPSEVTWQLRGGWLTNFLSKRGGC